MSDFLANLVRREIFIPAYAKINLTLEVLGMRDDGYHAIRSIVSPIALHDDVRISANNSGEITLETVTDNGVDLSALGPVEKNIAVRAARVFLSRLRAKEQLSIRASEQLSNGASGQGAAQRQTSSTAIDCSRLQSTAIENHCVGNEPSPIRQETPPSSLLPPHSLGCALRITKRIPLGGGLGGGSADGAATLRGLNAMFAEPPFSLEELMEMGAEVGSDVPSMVHGGTVLMEGRGENVTALTAQDGHSPLQTYHLVLANPGINVSTAEAYKKCHSQDAGLTSTPFLDNILRSSNCGRNLKISADWLFNGLEEAVFAMHPEIERLAARLKEAGAKGVLMSGSGATVFALAETQEEAERIARSISAECRWTTITETLPDGVMAAHGPLEA